MADEAGFKLDGEFFPWSESYDIPTCMVVEQVTGMPFEAFVEAIDDSTGTDSVSVSVMAGMMAASIYHKYPNWSTRKIKRLLAFDPGSDALEIVNVDTEPEGAEVVQLPPPALAEEEAPSENLSQKSTDEADPQNSGETPLSDSGNQTSLSTTA